MDSNLISILLRKQDLTIPSWVPKPGKFRAFTLNVPTDSGPAGQAILNNWCGGTPLDDFSPLGGVGYHGGGEHYSWKDYGGFLGLNLLTQLYEMCALSPKGPHMSPVFGSGDPTDKWGAFLDDGTPASKHTYNGIQQRLAKWGAGPRGSLVRISHTGGQCMPMSIAPYPPEGAGYAATWELDPIKGQKKFTGNQLYDYGGGAAIVNDAPFTGIDFQREGWWSKPRSGSGHGARMCFTSGRTGLITSYPTPLRETGWGHIHAFDDEDLLVFLSGVNHSSNWDVSVVPRPTSLDPNVPNPPWVPITQTGEEAPSYDLSNYLGYMGMRYCDHPNYKAFVGMDAGQSAPLDGLHIKMWILTPPPPGKRLIEPWVWTTEILESEDGSEIRPQIDGGSSNGSFNKLGYCPKVKSFPWTRNVWDRGQALRLQKMD